MNALRMNINRECNLDCDYCYMDLRPDYMTFDTFRLLLNRYSPESLSISGGEPFLHPDIFGMLELAVQHVQRVNVVTNGTLLKRYSGRIRRVAESIYPSTSRMSFSFSLDRVQKRQAASGAMLEMLKEMGFSIRVYLFPDGQGIDRELGNLSSIAALVDTCQLLFPVPMGRNSDRSVKKAEWEAVAAQFIEFCRSARIEPLIQRGYSNVLTRDGDDDSPVAASVFADYDGSVHECCLLSEIFSTGTRVADEKCGVAAGAGCLALERLHGRDYRFSEDPAPPCPLVANKIDKAW